MVRGPPARAVDWAILVVLLGQALSGVGSIFVGTESAAWVIVAHAIGGLVLVVLVGVKLWRVRNRLEPGSWQRDTGVSVALTLLALGALGTGILWASGWRPWVSRWTLLTIHALLGLGLLPPLLVHLHNRFHRPRRVDFAERRTAVQFLALAGVGTVAWRLQDWLTTLIDAPARFTGSYETESFAGNAFPTTSWVADDPDPVDPATWQLGVDGAVENVLSLGVEDLVRTDEQEALLDCTSGWYSTQRWRGLPVAGLLAEAGPTDEARWVVFHSITGYRWSLPLDEARDTLLATHVTGERLSHGHGYPLRLVAPGRRGFQWVKWVERVEVRQTPDYGQWIAIFTSGFE